MRVTFSQFWRCLTYGVSTFWGVLHVSAQADFTWKYEPRSLGAADRYGYALYTVPLVQLSMDGEKIPLRAEFSTDPRPNPSPSPLGRGWSVNFFSSALVEVDQDSIRWHRPDGRIFFFILERGNATAQKGGVSAPVVFKSKDGSWIASKLPKTRIITLTHSESGAEFIYEDGLLVRFAFRNKGQNAEQYSITYNGTRRPVRLATFGTGKLLAEFSYDNSERAKSLSLGEANSKTAKPIVFKYATASLSQFDTGPYLINIGNVALTPLNIVYRAEEGGVNRIDFERSALGSTSSLLWEARTGFIVKDEGASYNIVNPSLANGGKPEVGSKSKSQVMDYNWRPEEAKVTRVDKDGTFELRFYDRSQGILMETDKYNVTTKTYYLLASGPMYGAVRKKEEIKDRKIVVLERNAYDDKGRIVRRIDADQNMMVWDYLEGGSYVKKTLNGQVAQELFYDSGGRLTLNKIYTDGVVHEYATLYLENEKRVLYSRNGEFTWGKIYKNGVGLISFFENSGKRTVWASVAGRLTPTLIQQISAEENPFLN